MVNEMREGNFNCVEKGLGVRSQELELGEVIAHAKSAKFAKSDVESQKSGADFFNAESQSRRVAEIAKAWPMVRLGDVCEVINGLWKGTKEPLINVGVIRATNFTKQCEFDVTKTVFIDVEEKKFLKRKLQFGDIIVERSGGGPNQPVGRVIYFDQKDGNYSLSNFTSALRVKNSIDLDPYFLYRVLVACYGTGVTEKMQSNSVQLRNIDFERYLNIQIPLPPIEVQKEIVERLEKELGEADKVAAEFKRMVELADKEFKAELDETFNSLSANSAPPREIKNDGCVDFVTRGVAEDAEKCPMVRLGDVCEVVTGSTPSKQHKEYYGGEYPFYKPGDLDQGLNVVQSADTLTDKGWKVARKLPVNTVLVTCIGSLGKSGIIRKEGACNQQINALVVKKAIPEFIYYCVLSSSFLFNLQQMSNATTLAIVNKSQFQNLKIPLPALSVQNEIVAKLDAAKERCEKLKAEAERGLRAAENLRKAILSETFE